MEVEGAALGENSWFAAVFPLIVSLLALRLAYLIYWCGRPLRRSSGKGSLRTLIVLGSGGHTAEMLSIVSVLRKDRYAPRFYVAALTDSMSLQKAQVLEETLTQQESVDRRSKSADFMQVYRSREVGQSYITSIGTTLVATMHALWLVLKIRPQVVLCNGPGTCIPLCISAFLLKIIGFGWSSIFYVESIARVRKLSLSGLLLYKLRIADQFFVQWPALQQKYPRAEYAGRLM